MYGSYGWFDGNLKTTLKNGDIIYDKNGDAQTIFKVDFPDGSSTSSRVLFYGVVGAESNTANSSDLFVMSNSYLTSV